MPPHSPLPPTHDPASSDPSARRSPRHVPSPAPGSRRDPGSPHDPRTGQVSVPTWLLGSLGAGTALAGLLGLLLWSGRSQRFTRMQPRGIDGLPDILPALEGLTRTSRVEGNRVSIFENGDGFFPALIEDVERAKSSIHLELYAWWTGDICHRLADALCQRARGGIEVRLLLDAMGSWMMEDEIQEELRSCGVQLLFYHDVKLRTLGRLNKRDHRKVAVFDGRWGWMFGHGVSSFWEGNGDRPESWRDLALRITGPAVGHLQSVFANNWMEESAELLSDDRYFPALEPTGDTPLQVFASSPRGGVSNSSIVYRVMIAAARETLDIANPYFAPADEVVDLLCAAVGRGVRVRILLPGPHTDSRIVQYAGRYQFHQLLDAGVEIYRFQPTLNHQKVMIVDRSWAYVGSANFDERSFDINAEAGVGILDEKVCAELLEIYERDLERAELLETDVWSSRPFLDRCVEGLCFLVRGQL